ncbi:hypothetical protein RJ640_022340 [Escallonia rubra]|uniref:Uncharacterized protein n=1 Tax=Escallonia rubra TaxID=112253 RepID=A0AA88U0E6_9ASTE|nr:hypothetical protein RJ640_022340 [Escallonia rubra]
MDGSEGLLHDVIRAFSSPVTWTRSPVSRSRALELVVELETFDDQSNSFLPSKTARLPSSKIFNIPNESFNGLSLLATHTTCGSEATGKLYMMPTYRFVELKGVKNPSLKALSVEGDWKRGKASGKGKFSGTFEGE